MAWYVKSRDPAGKIRPVFCESPMAVGKVYREESELGREVWIETESRDLIAFNAFGASHRQS